MLNEAATSQLRGYFERAERLSAEAAEIADSQKELLVEVKAAGFDPAVFKEGLKVRRQDKAARAERGELLDLYLAAAEAG